MNTPGIIVTAFFRFFVIVLLILPLSGVAQVWPQWRGVDRDGNIPAHHAPKQLPDHLTLEWQIDIGAGYSSPVMDGERIFLHTRKGENEVVSSHDLKSGRVLWTAEYPAPFQQNPYATKHGKGPNSTPILHQGRLYTFGMSEILSSFDAASGKLLWRNDYSKNLDSSKLFCGAGLSPIISGQRLIVHVGDDRGGALVAVDKMTGEEIWRTEGDGPGYASPILATFAGVPQVITLSDGACIGVALETGKLLWRLPFADDWNENIVTPVLYEDLLIVSGVRQGTMALKIGRGESEWTVDRIWENKKLPMYMSSPVLSQGRLYGFSSASKGKYFCLDPRTGQLVWESPGRMGMTASVQVAGEQVYGLNTEGQLVIAEKSGQEYRMLKEYHVAQSTAFPHPIFIDGKMVVKDMASLSLWSF